MHGSVAFQAIDQPFLFNTCQSFWSLIVGALAYYFLEPQNVLPITPKAAVGLMSLAVLSTVFAFWLQVWAQRYLAASLSSLLFLLESPFAMGFGLVILKEQLSSAQFIGAALIMVAAYFAVKFEAKADPV